MGRRPDPFWLHAERLPDQGGFKCNFCKCAFKGAGATRIKHHLAGGIRGIKSGIKSCADVPPNVKEEAAIEIFRRNMSIGRGTCKIFLLFKIKF